MKTSIHGVTVAAAALAAALSVTVAGPHRAYAAPTAVTEGDLGITLLSPAPHSTFSGAKPVEIDAFYQGTDTNQITEVDLYIDGVRAASKSLTAPESRGVISFLVDSSALSGGAHAIVVRAVAADAEVISVKGSFTYQDTSAANDNAGLPTVGGDATGAPEVSISSPAMDSRIEGTVRISVSASDPSGKDPYVSYFVDRSFKTLRNYPPYDFIWDSTTVPNGLHTVEIYAYNDSQNVGPAKILRLYVNNPGGFTNIRTDLKDLTQTPAKAIAPIVTKPKSVAAAVPIVKKPKSVAAVAPVVTKPKSVAAAVPIVAKPKPAALLMPVKKTLRTAVPVLKAKRVAPMIDMAPAAMAPVPVVLKSSHPLPSIKMAMNLAAGSQLGVTTAPKVTTPVAPKTNAKSLLAPARMSRTPVTLSTSTTQVASLPTIASPGMSYEPALTSPFKNLTKTPAIEMASVRLPNDELSSPFKAHAAPVTVKPMVVKPIMLHPMLMKLDLPKRTTVKAATPEVHVSKVVEPIASVPMVTTETRRIEVHTVGTPGLYNMLRCKGEMAVMIGDTTVRLDRPLAARGSILFGPLRQIFEFEGGQLIWKSATQTVVGESPNRNLTLQIGNRKAEVNDKNVTLPGAPYLQRGRTMVPVQLLPAALDANVQYNPTNGHLLITSKN